MNSFILHYSRIRSFPIAFWIVIAATFINQIGNMAIVFLILYLNDHLQFSLAHASFAFVTFSTGMLISGIVGGSLVDKFGAARMMTLSLFANGTVFVFFPIAHAYFNILFLCMLVGLAYGLYRPASQTFVSQLSVPGMYKLTFSVYRLVINLGMSIGPALGGYLAYYSFTSIFFVNGIANLIASAILFAGLFRSSWFKRRPTQPIVIGFKWLLHDAALRLFVMGMIPIFMIFFQHESTLAIFLHRNLHFPMYFYGLLFSLNTLLIVFFELPLNVATMNWPYRLNLTLGSFFITAGFAGLYFATEQWHVILLAIIWTLGEMILYPAATSYIAEIAPESRRGSYMSMYSTCTNVGMLLGPWGGAIIMEKFGASSLWVLCGWWGLIAIVILCSLSQSVDQFTHEQWGMLK